MQFKKINTIFDDAFLIDDFKADDNRGSLIKDFKYNDFKELLDYDFQMKEVFYTISKKGVVRAIHFQNEPKAQTKIIRVIKGKVYDIIVDLRPHSKTYGKWQGFTLTEDKPISVFIPKGFGHGYLVLEDSIVSYLTDEDFYGEYDSGIMWNDKDINIKWPLELVDQVILSEKDKNLMSFKEYTDKMK